MKYTIKTMILLGTMLCLLVGCGEQPESSVSVAQTPETFGLASIAETPEEQGTVTDGTMVSAEEASGMEELAESSAETPLETDLTELAIKSAVCAVYMDGLSYNNIDPVYFWRSVGYLIGQVGTQSPDISAEGDVLKIAAEDLSPFVAALFGPYEGQYPSLGEENPLVTSEYGDEGEVYSVTSWDLASMEVTVSEPELQEDGSYLCQAELLENGTAVGTYRLTLTDYIPSDGETPLFAYCITGLEEQQED